MAIVAPNGQDPNQQNQPNMGGSGTITGGGGAPAGGGGGSAYQAPAASRGNPSGTPNVQDYLNANQGAGQKLSGAISGNVQNQANQVQQNYNTSQQQLGSMYDTANQNLSQGQSAANSAFQNPQDLLNAYQASKAQANPTPGSTPAAPDQQNLQAYNQFQGDVAGTQQYNQNQQQIQNYGQAGQQAVNNLQPQLGQLQQTAAMGANQMGQNQLLQQAVGTPNYSTGQKTLDSLFLSGQSNQLNQNLNDIYNQTNQQTQNLAPDYQQKLSALQGLSGQNAAYAQNLFLNGNDQGTGLNQIAGNAQKEYDAQVAANAAGATQGGTNFASLQDAASQNNGQGRFTADQLKQLNLNPGMQAWGVGLGQDITQTALNPAAQGGLAQTTTPEEFARYNALNQLAGGPSGAAQQSVFGSARTGGGYNPIGFDNTKFLNAVQDKQKAITQTDLLNTVNANRSTSPDPFLQNTLNQIQSGVSSGQMSPQQAQDLVQQQIQYAQAHGGNAAGENAAAEFQPFTNYYNNVYSPAAGDVLGQNLGVTQGRMIGKRPT